MTDRTDIVFAWRAEVTDAEVVALTISHGGNASPGWWDRIRPHSMGWVTARLADGALIGFVDVAWDGGDHAFLLDAKVRPDHQHRGIGTEVVRLAARQAKAAGCEWLEVDFTPPLDHPCMIGVVSCSSTPGADSPPSFCP